MKWSYVEPSMGDMVRVAVGSIYHFGIYVSDDEVIQFGLPPSRRSRLMDSEVEVLASGIDEFLDGGFLEVCEFDRKERKNNRSPKEIVSYARSKIGMKGYHIIHNNCEHFANECVTGSKVCSQTDALRTMFNSLPLVDVYVALVPENEPVGRLGHAERQSEIDGVSNERLKREKYFVWKLLEYALDRSFGARGKKLTLKRESYGGWTAGEVEISISHSGGALAVAVSRAPVGVDIETVHSPRSERFAEKIMTVDEAEAFSAIPESEREERLMGVWTAKEAIFKSKKLAKFSPIEQNTLAESYKTDTLTLGGARYVWSVATNTPEKIRVFSDIDLAKIK